MALDTGVLYREDNLARLREMPTDSVDLVYLDPPFFSNRVYEVIWGDEAEVRSFEDRWEGGIRHYVDWMRQRVAELHRVLKPTGSLYLHCDPTASHHLKVMLDEVFGLAGFRNEIVWQRSVAKGDARRKLGALHDLIFFYTKSQTYVFAPPRREPDGAYLGRFDLDDGDGRGPYRLAPLDSPNLRPNLVYEYEGYTPPAKGWRVSLEAMRRLDAERRLAFPRRRDGRIARKHYLAEQKKPALGDVWTDIRPLQASSRERLGYPTQKPEALLERIIQMSSQPGDVVLDPFCGCGTTIAVAESLDRRWLGIDISPTAMEIMRRRLQVQTRNTVTPRIQGLPDSIDELKRLKPFEFQNWVVAQINGTHAARQVHDMGIDGYTFLTREPVQVKRSESVGRNVVDNFETALRRASSDAGWIIAFSFTKGAREEVLRARSDGLHIRLVKVADLLNQPRQAAHLDELLRRSHNVTALPAARSPDALPTADELIASARASG